MQANEKNIVRRILDPSNPPPLSARQKKRLSAVAAMPDENIDYSDAPFVPDAEWVKSNRLPIRNKIPISLRVDPDVLDFFRGAGNRYQTRMNAVLRSYVEASRAHAGM